MGGLFLGNVGSGGLKPDIGSDGAFSAGRFYRRPPLRQPHKNRARGTAALVYPINHREAMWQLSTY